MRAARARAARLAAALAGAAACSAGASDVSPADSTGFVVVRGPDTVLVEGMVTRGDTTRGRLTVGHRARMNYVATSADDGASLELRIVAPDAPSDAPQTPAARGADVTVRGNRAQLTMLGGDGRRETRFRVADGTIPFAPPSVGLLIRALAPDRLGAGSRAERSVLVVPPGGAERVRPQRRGDSLFARVDGNDWVFVIDRVGRVVAGHNVTRQLVVRRVPYPTAAALAVRPSRFAPAPGAGPYAPPAAAPYRATHVRIPAGAGRWLAGTLTVPNGAAPAPAVLLVSGSSPQDRDMAEGDSPYRPFRQLADTLGRRGVAVLRYDDRGVGESTGDFATSNTADRAEDARVALAFLRRQSEVDPSRVIVAGLSEGGVIAPMLAADDSTLRGIVVMAAPGDSGVAVARYQTVERVRADLRIRPARRDSAVDAQMRSWLGSAARDRWVAFFVAYDPFVTARRVRVPALILHGDADRNVPPAHAGRLRDAMLAAGNPDVTMRRFPGVSHPLLADPDGSQRGEMYLYSFDIAPEVVGTLVDWVVARVR